ncbi:MAG: phytanoyl-CoA dioxygenase, partial [Phycisphaeraceae bacterium]|nr:phytanoyl-CoA dioxygenase [Phycisphaeraceae bacterium]
MDSRLRPAQVRFYRDQGYLIFDKPVFEPETFTALRQHIEARLDAWTEALGKPLDMVDWPHFVDPKLNEWLLADRVLDLVEPLIGPDIALFACSFITKLPGASKAAP